LAKGELAAQAIVKEYLTVQTEGQRQVFLYSLPLTLAVGYRMRSLRDTQFRQRA